MTKKTNVSKSIRYLKAIQEMVGTRKDLANMIGIKPETINYWIARNKVPKRYACSLSYISDNKFTPKDFLGDE